MSTDDQTTIDDLREELERKDQRIDELEQQMHEIASAVEQQDKTTPLKDRTGISRRELMGAALGGSVLGLGGAAASQEFSDSAEAAGSPAPDVGTPNDRVDVFGAEIDSNSVSADVSRTKSEPVYNVKHPDFGAVGDGSADDTAAIQAAIDAADSNGRGLVFIPEGDYRITSKLTVNSEYTAVEGVGKRSSRIVADGYSGPILHIDGDSNNTYSASNRVEHLSLKGDGSNTTNGIQAEYVIHGSLLINDVWVSHCLNKQILADECWGGTIRNAYCGAANIGNFGIRVNNANAFTIRDSYILNISDSTSGANSGVFLFEPDGAIVDGVTVEDCSRGVIIDGGGNGGNSIRGLYTERLQAQGVLVNYATATDGVRITDSHILTPGDAIRIAGDANQVFFDNIRTNGGTIDIATGATEVEAGLTDASYSNASPTSR